MSNPQPHLELRVVREGPSWVVVNKPAGLLSVPGKGDDPRKKDCAASRVRALYPAATGPLIVHRLDMDTSGLLVLGLTERAQKTLSRQFEERRVEKRYVALLAGEIDRDEGEVNLPIRPDPAHRPYQVIDALDGRVAITRWRVLSREAGRTRVEFTPITGRAHQLRVHAAASEALGGIGRCIVGDVLYGSGYRGPPDTIPPPPSGPHGVLAPADRLMLHASYLAFADPETGEPASATSAPPF